MVIYIIVSSYPCYQDIWIQDSKTAFSQVLPSVCVSMYACQSHTTDSKFKSIALKWKDITIPLVKLLPLPFSFFAQLISADVLYLSLFCHCCSCCCVCCTQMLTFFIFIIFVIHYLYYLVVITKIISWLRQKGIKKWLSLKDAFMVLVKWNEKWKLVLLKYNLMVQTKKRN